MDWITVHAFTYPHEAHIAKVKLESEGIEVRLLDELTTQVHNFYSNAIGGVKLQVKVGNEDTAKEILKEMHVIEEMPQEASPFLIYLDAFTRKIPFVGDTILELRIIVLVVLILLLLFLPMAIFQ
ncbi:DUF2007 domain-containing protein [bacterium SCSIO 12643]|nr:DUF2007 domain-containing protein [bacterium SCSIO 12643]